MKQWPENWDELRTAWQVAHLGTISAAADALGVHRATVIRHIDALEEELGQKLFQRHSKGYTPTEAGLDLMQVGATTDEQFTQLLRRIKGKGSELSGELIITSLESAASLLLPALNRFQTEHPAITIRILTDNRLFKLEYGEAHVAIRAGKKPDQPDNVVQHFAKVEIGLYAHESYVTKKGIPKTLGDFNKHKFIGTENLEDGAPSIRWMRGNIPKDRITFKASSQRVIEEAILSGLGIGFLLKRKAMAAQGMVEVYPPLDEWQSNLWLVTHVDLHRTTKVQAFLKILKEMI
jgi:DNA-binding transcriptional LysR family regulator